MKWTEIVIKTKRDAYDAISNMLISMGSGGVVVHDPLDIMEKIAYHSLSTNDVSPHNEVQNDVSTENNELSGTGNEYAEYTAEYINEYTDEHTDEYAGKIGKYFDEYYEYYDECIDEKLLQEISNMEKDTVILKSYFPASENLSELMQLIQEKLKEISEYLDVGDIKVEYSEVNDEDWANSWKKYYKPFNITEKIVIKPTWEDYDNKEGKIVIEMDPGMAFGTGTHETTRMCANLLEKYTHEGDKIIDVGSGSGILTLIAAKLGATKILALDVDKEAVKVTLDNCKHNGVIDKVIALHGTLKKDIEESYGNDKADLKCKADLIVANIIAGVIIDLADDILHHLKPGGLFITSGIIKSKKEMVIERYLKKKFECIEVKEDGEWVAIVFKCPDSL
ncbi:MAG TPA: 50S ribosomal protein L11 methyltransferase [Clostridiaceae bacterium]|nr:50S ribosomal protein L11 methyltransferase [Clostridiaceae bacterium]